MQMASDLHFGGVMRWQWASPKSGFPTLIFAKGRDDRAFRLNADLWISNVDCVLDSAWLAKIGANCCAS